jgi:hypothetical protein
MTNPWVPVITGSAAILAAVIALIGVHYGQWLQTRRETGLRAELWQREDRHRFTAEKREIYADLLTEFSRWRRALEGFKWSKKVRGSSINPNDFVEWVSRYANSDTGRRSVDLTLGRIRLVSLEIWQAANEHAKLLDSATDLLIWDEDTKPRFPNWEAIDTSLNTLSDAMRADLGADIVT